MGQKHKRFREFRTSFPQRDPQKSSEHVRACAAGDSAPFVPKIENLSHIMGPTPILEMRLRSRFPIMAPDTMAIRTFPQ